ncbi:MAG: VIT domain-containing protein, partial [Planctomycetota bacterium]|nr:VIT domain-containing protein [Planctomycetota bacterium]
MRFQFRSLWVLSLLLLLPATAQAQGFIVVDDDRYHPPHVRKIWPRYFPLQIKSHRVDTDLTGSLARTKIDQVFYNPNPIQMEGTFIFPIPAGAAFDELRLTMNGKEVAGEILDRDKARQIYEGIVRKMRDPALVEFMDGGMFKARIFPIPARGDTRVKLQYSQILPREASLREYRYPLKTQRFTSAPIETLSITCRIETNQDLNNIYSPTHSVDVTRSGSNKATVGMELKNVTPERDFQLFFSTSGKAVGLDLITHHRPAEEGFFLAILSPHHELDRKKILPKDLVFVLDTSGSMADDGKLVQAKAALRNCISRLGAEDRFSVIEFATEARVFRQGLVPATDEMKEAAKAFIDDLEARGGTNIHDALIRALEPLDGRDSNRPYMVCFLTDGLPTVGITASGDLLNAIRKKNGERARIFTFGVGYDVNTHLLDKVAEENRGSRQYVSPEENIEVKVSSFYDRISHPVMTDLILKVDGVWTKDIYPRRIPDLFYGSQVILLGRYKGEGSHAIRLSGSFLGEQKEFVFEGTFAKEAKRPAIPRLWALRKVGYLLDQIRLNGDSKEVKDEIVRLAKKYGIITPYTSYLVMEEGEVAGLPPLPAPRRALRRHFGEKHLDAGAEATRGAPRAMRLSKGKGSQDL